MNKTKNEKHNELSNRFVLEVMVDEYIEYLEHYLGKGLSPINKLKKNANGESSVWVRIPKWNRPREARVADFRNALLEQFCCVYAYTVKHSNRSMPKIRMIDTKTEPINNPIRPRKKIMDSYNLPCINLTHYV
jgi:hypothetical protein